MYLYMYVCIYTHPHTHTHSLSLSLSLSSHTLTHVVPSETYGMPQLGTDNADGTQVCSKSCSIVFVPHGSGVGVWMCRGVGACWCKGAEGIVGVWKCKRVGLCGEMKKKYQHKTIGQYLSHATWLRCYGVTTISRLLKIIGLFCKRAL